MPRDLTQEEDEEYEILQYDASGHCQSECTCPWCMRIREIEAIFYSRGES